MGGAKKGRGERAEEGKGRGRGRGRRADVGCWFAGKIREETSGSAAFRLIPALPTNPFLLQFALFPPFLPFPLSPEGQPSPFVSFCPPANLPLGGGW